MHPTEVCNRRSDDDIVAPGAPMGAADALPESLTLDQLGSRTVTVAGHLATGTFELLTLVGEIDARGAHLIWGALSCAAWLANTCELEYATARSQVRVARALRSWPVLATSMANGDVSYAKARMLVPHLSDRHVDELVDLAATTPTSRLAAAIAAWSHRNESDHDIAVRQHDERSCSWRTDPDGMITISARLAPAQAARVCAVIDKTVTTTNTSTGASLAQQRADALTDCVTRRRPRSFDDDAVERADTEVVVHVTADGNRLCDGTPLTDHDVTRMLPDSFVSLLICDNQRQPIDASPRRRLPTRRQRRVIEARSNECEHPGCHARTFLQADHITPYDQGGRTTLDNLRRLCGPHNRARVAAG